MGFFAFVREIAGDLAADRTDDDALFITASAILHARPDLQGRDKRLDAMRVLYVASMIHLGRTGNALFPDDFEATGYGPLVPRLHKDLSRHRPRCLHHEFNSLTHEQIRSISLACEGTRNLDGGRMVALTHRNDGAWGSAYVPGDRIHRGRLMAKEHIAQDYRRLTA